MGPPNAFLEPGVRHHVSRTKELAKNGTIFRIRSVPSAFVQETPRIRILCPGQFFVV